MLNLVRTEGRLVRTADRFWTSLVVRKFKIAHFPEQYEFCIPIELCLLLDRMLDIVDTT